LILKGIKIKAQFLLNKLIHPPSWFLSKHEYSAVRF